MDGFKHKKGLKSQKIRQGNDGLTSRRSKLLDNYESDENDKSKDRQPGVSGYLKKTKGTYEKLDEAGEI